MAALQTPYMVPLPAYRRYLQSLVENGFGKRVMFGSDFPDQAASSIEAITGATFLTADQKEDVLCNNAARFLQLNTAICAP